MKNTVLLVCEGCFEMFDHTYHGKNPNNKRFCNDCVLEHKHIGHQTERTLGPVGRPLNPVPSLVSTLAWDEPNLLGF